MGEGHCGGTARGAIGRRTTGCGKRRVSARVGRRSVTPGEAGRKPALWRLAILAHGLRLQPRALILLVPPHPITTAARPVPVLLALQVAIDPIAADPDRAAVREHLDVAVDLDPIDPHRAALFELDVAANPRIGY